ncbi:MAG: dihydrodipicolinate synthase family protein [Chloroflexota bacterium]|nr:dihydrodipicolinate synthase family protein [Chloroflexota bacterium]
MKLTELDHRPLIVAAVTPLTDDGLALDEGAIAPYASFLASHGADGIFACGTTGEGVLLSLDERRRAAAGFRRASRGVLVVHAGAQTTADSVALAAHAAEIGADAVAVIPPPYFALDADALTAHFVAAARACAPLPFYCYAFTARSGYPLPVEVIRRIGESVDNLAGLKVSESPFDRVEPYLELGLPVLIGSEPLIAAGLAHGAIGTVSGMAAAFPDVVREALDAGDEAAMGRLRELRGALEASGQFIAAAKHLLGLRGIPVTPGMRAPLRRLSPDEAQHLEAAVNRGVALAL